MVRPQGTTPSNPFHFEQDDILYTRGIVVMDEERRPRVIIGELGERMHGASTGIAIRDEETERFGVGVDGTGAIVMGFDAPLGVGAPMPDRLALGVDARGQASVRLINNDTAVVARLATGQDERGALEFLDWEDADIDWDSIEDLSTFRGFPALRGTQRFAIGAEYVPTAEDDSK